ncbi:MAG TPA: sigma-70 family RNA polymerase sigma factor [Blastocatellia bacterium]|jgi:RNA polymerase sigma-70 factor (ECF subfamily)|nr:sigma-70 family RNA polymerase sigma factor [Blastocatellia bacterium]
MTKCENEERIIDGCRRGDRAAFQLLFEMHKDKVYSIALHFTGEEASARDISQQVFLKLFTIIGQYRSESQFTTWLYRVVANACLDDQRKQRRFVPFSHSVEVNNMVTKGSQEDTYIRRQTADSVRTAIAGLSPKLRLPILLKYVEDLSYDEIASVLGCSKGTVASRLNRGHKALARKLGHLRGTLVPGD